MKTKKETFPSMNLFYISLLIFPILLLFKVESNINEIKKWILLASPILAINIICYFVNRNFKRKEIYTSSRLINLLALFFSVWLFYYCLFIIYPDILEPFLSNINSQSLSFLIANIVLLILGIFDYRKEINQKDIYITPIILSGCFILGYIIYPETLFYKI